MRFEPHDYQRYCVTRIIQEPALGLFLDMGLGKTVITLTAVNDLIYNRFQVGKCLVVAPKKVAEDTWTREQQKWEHLKLLKIVSVLGSKPKRIKALNSPGNVYIINRENIPWLVDYYRNAWPFDMVVIDESSSFKSYKAVRFKKLRNVRGHIRRIVELTGTPSPNGLTDLWAQLYLLDGGQRLGRTITEYRNNYFSPASRNATAIFSYLPLPGAEERIWDNIRDICVSLSAEDYLQLPERIDNIRYVRLDSKARHAYEEMEKERILELDGETLDAGSAAILTGKLLQIANGAVYHTAVHETGPDTYEEERSTIEVHDNKLEAFLELVEALGGRHALVFYSFQHDLVRIRRALDKMQLRVDEIKNAGSIEKWNAGETDILLAHPASAAYGLNLQDGGSDVIWFGLNQSLELYLQANARLLRQGQKHKVRIHSLVVADSIDEDVMASLGKKEDCQAALLEALKARIGKYRKDQEGDNGNG